MQCLRVDLKGRACARAERLLHLRGGVDRNSGVLPWSGHDRLHRQRETSDELGRCAGRYQFAAFEFCSLPEIVECVDTREIVESNQSDRFRPVDAGSPAIDQTGASPYFSGMAKLPIITLPDPLLRKASAPVERVDEALRKLADDMLDTMYAAPGVGLAAVQVGKPIRMLVLDTAKEEEAPQPLMLVNPQIVSLGSEMRLHEEGCLSIPDVRIEIERPSSLVVRFIGRDGKSRELAAEGLLATVIQHEVDHLNGKLIIDFLSRLKRDIIIRKFKKQAKEETA